MGRATIGDVAKLAKVSQSTVSRALRGMDKVNPATRRRIEEAADQLDFTLSKSAGALASGRTMRVLLLMSGAMDTWFNASMMRGVHEVLGPAGYDVAPHAIHNKRELDDYFEALPKNRNADAIIIASFQFTEDLHRQLAEHGMPVVGLDAPAATGFDASIAIDNAGGMAQAVRTLASLGHRRIAFVGGAVPPDMFFSATSRLTLFGDAAREAGYAPGDFTTITVVTDTANGDPLDPDIVAADAAAQLLSSAVRPTGVCTETDNLAAILMKELRHQRVRIPEDMSVIGFDDSPTAQLTDLTTIRQDPLELGHVAAAKTLALLQGHSLPIPHETQPLRLVLRDTTSRAPRD